MPGLFHPRVQVAGPMPRIGGGHEKPALDIAAGSVAHRIPQPPGGVQSSDIDLPHRVAESVAEIFRARRRGDGGFLQQHPQITRLDGILGQAQGAAASGDRAAGERLPATFRILVGIDRIFAVPILDLVAHGVGRPPSDADGVHRGSLPEVGDQPLRVSVIALAGVAAIQIGVTFPKGFQAAVGQSRVTVVLGLVDGVAPARQPIAERDPDRGARPLVRSPVTPSAFAVAPAAARIPVPSLDSQFGAQAVGKGAQTGGEHSAQRGRTIDRVGIAPGMAIHPGAERGGGDEGAGGTRRQIDGNPDRRRHPVSPQQRVHRRLSRLLRGRDRRRFRQRLQPHAPRQQRQDRRGQPSNPHQPHVFFLVYLSSRSILYYSGQPARRRRPSSRPTRCLHVDRLLVYPWD